MSRSDESRRLYDEGRTLMAAGDFENAVFAFERSIAVEPHFKSLELLGECYLQLGRPVDAIVPLAAATCLNPQVRAPSLLADAYFRLGVRDEARKFLEVALARDPGNRLALRLLQELDEEA